MRPPEGVERIRWAGARGWVVPEAREWVEEHLTRWGTLDRAAAHAEDVISMRGRGVVRAIPAPRAGRWVVRPYLRGGWVAKLLDDRYLRLGPRRPEKEMRAAWIARARGIATPRPIAALSYARGLWYRGEIVTVFVPNSVDMAGLLFHDRWPGATEPAPVDARHAVLRAAGEAVIRLARAGIHHRDLNAKNLLAVRPGEEVVGADPELLVLDLDRCRIHPGPIQPGVMAARLERSLEKFEGETGRGISAAGWAAFREGLSVE